MALSYSQLSTYRRCPKQYEFASIKKISRPLSAGESFGSSLHNTLRKFGLLEMEKQAPAKKQLKLFTEDHTHNTQPELTLTTLMSLWRESFIAEGYESPSIMQERLTEGEKALEHYYEWWKRKKRTVLGIEKGFSLQVPETDIVLSGRFDRIESMDGGILVIDYKSSKPRPEKEVAEDLQLSIYAAAAGKIWQTDIIKLALVSVRKEGVSEVITTRNEAALAVAMKDIQKASDGIQKQIFTALPSISICQHCPYRGICSDRIG